VGLALLLTFAAALGATDGSATAVAAPAATTGAAAPASGTAAAPPKADAAARRILFAAPMENGTGQEQYDPVAAGVGDLVSVLLAEQKQIKVVERQRFDALTKEQALTLKGLTGEKYAIQAGKLMEADTVLAGRLYMDKGQPLVSVKALEIASARVVAAAEVSCRHEDLMESALQLARKLAEQMAAPLPEIDLKMVDKSPIAGLHFAKALSFYYAGNLDEALMQLMRTIDLDPDYVEVHYWSGLCYYRQSEWPHAVIEWEKLLKRCPQFDRAAKVSQMLADAQAKAKLSTPPDQPLVPKAEPTKEVH
jgi:tetratricopeptide (TPR) repeat protein